MKEFDQETIKRMRNEDVWIGNPNYPELMYMVHDFETIGNMEMAVELVELESVDYNQSPALHCFLAQLHKKCRNELDVKFKERIEQLKLNQIGKQYLWGYMHMSGPEIQAHLAAKGKQDFGFDVAGDYLESRLISGYIADNNFLRAHRHLTKSLELSQTNPTVFKRIIEPEVIKHMLPWAIDGVVQHEYALRFMKMSKEERKASEGYCCLPEGSYMVMGIMNENLKKARERLEKFSIDQEVEERLKALEIDYV